MLAFHDYLFFRLKITEDNRHGFSSTSDDIGKILVEEFDTKCFATLGCLSIFLCQVQQEVHKLFSIGMKEQILQVSFHMLSSQSD